MNLLEAIPAEWIKASIGKYCDVQLGKMLQNDSASEGDELKRYLRAKNITKSGLDLSHDFSMWIKPQEVGRFRLRRGDILVSEGGDAGRTAVFDSDVEYYFQNAINRVRPIGDVRILPEFIYYWFTFLKVAGYVEMVCNVATISHFTAEKVKAAPLALPPRETQRRIAQFLDEKTARVDELIEKKHALLDRLAEKRQALITQAVTKGLNPAAPLKDSGIDWLGSIPAHWTLAALGYRYEVQLGRMLNAERADGENLRPYLRVFDVQWGEINTDELPLMDFPPDAQERYRLCTGDLLVNEGGSYVGRSAIWRGELEECYYQKALHRLRPLHIAQDTAEFLYFVMEAATRNAVFVAGGNQTTIDHLTAEQLQHYRFGFPPLSEQVSIASALNKMLEDDAGIVKRIKVSIARLQEYRTALITAAVTGKITTLAEGNVVAKPAKREVNNAFKRSVLAARIADAFCDQPTFGRVKFQKTLHLCEAHLGLEEIAGNYYRRAAGPFDTQMMRSVHSQLEKQGWFKIEQREGGKGSHYRRGPKLNAYRNYYDRYFSVQAEAIDALLALLSPMNTERAEVISTAYAAWNDLLLDGKAATDDEIVHLILNDWADEKRRIPEDRWRKALGWMQEKGLTPQGTGSHTKRT